MLVAACGWSDPFADFADASSDGGGGQVPDEPEPALPDDPEPEPEVAAHCETLRHTPSDARVLFDVELACGHTMFAHYGVSVVAAASQAHLATAGFYDSWVFRIDDADIEALAGAPLLAQQRPLLAVDGDGRLIVGGFDGESRTIVLGELDQGWTTAAFEVASDYQAVDLDTSVDGRAALWAYGNGEDWRVTREAGQWAIEPIAVPSGAKQPRHALSVEGAEIAIDQRGDALDEHWHLEMQLDGSNPAPLGAQVDTLPHGWEPVHAAATVLAAELPRVLAVTGHVDGLSVDGVGPAGEQHLMLRDTAQRVASCPLLTDPELECPAPCHEQSRGVERGAFATARTADGTLWIALVESDVDLVIQYDWLCDELKGNCTCSDSVVDDSSTRTLRLLAVDPGGSTREALRLPLGAAAATSSFGIDLHAAGERLALAVTVGDGVRPALAAPAVRTLLLDVSASLGHRD